MSGTGGCKFVQIFATPGWRIRSICSSHQYEHSCDAATEEIELVASGIPELGELLNGEYIRGHTYLVQGASGTGKSLLGQHFLQAGLDADETVVSIPGEESRHDILVNAARLEVDIRDAEFLYIGPGTDFFAEDKSYNLVEATEVESEQFTQDIKHVIDGVDPARILIDPITQLQYVERDEYQCRKRLQSLIRFLRDRQVTTVATRTLDRERTGAGRKLARHVRAHERVSRGGPYRLAVQVRDT
jgi:circadian clock protein KaiC